jgi:hypothetical protein
MAEITVYIRDGDTRFKIVHKGMRMFDFESEHLSGKHEIVLTADKRLCRESDAKVAVAGKELQFYKDDECDNFVSFIVQSQPITTGVPNAGGSNYCTDAIATIYTQVNMFSHYLCAYVHAVSGNKRRRTELDESARELEPILAPSNYGTVSELKRNQFSATSTPQVECFGRRSIPKVKRLLRRSLSSLRARTVCRRMKRQGKARPNCLRKRAKVGSKSS